MKNISINPSILVQQRASFTLLLDLNDSELYKVDGDAAVLINFLNVNRSRKLSLEKIQQHLIEHSQSFKENSSGEESLADALNYFKSIRVLEYEA